MDQMAPAPVSVRAWRRPVQRPPARGMLQALQPKGQRCRPIRRPPVRAPLSEVIVLCLRRVTANLEGDPGTSRYWRHQPLGLPPAAGHAVSTWPSRPAPFLDCFILSTFPCRIILTANDTRTKRLSFAHRNDSLYDFPWTSVFFLPSSTLSKTTRASLPTRLLVRALHYRYSDKDRAHAPPAVSVLPLYRPPQRSSSGLATPGGSKLPFFVFDKTLRQNLTRTRTRTCWKYRPAFCFPLQGAGNCAFALRSIRANA